MYELRRVGKSQRAAMSRARDGAHRRTVRRSADFARDRGGSRAGLFHWSRCGHAPQSSCRRSHAAVGGKHRRHHAWSSFVDDSTPQGVANIAEVVQTPWCPLTTFPFRTAWDKSSSSTSLPECRRSHAAWRVANCRRGPGSFQEDITERIVERIVDDAVVALQTREQIVEVGPNLPQEHVRRRNIAQIFVLPGTQVGRKSARQSKSFTRKTSRSAILRTDR